jgi:hypothetical protein
MMMMIDDSALPVRREESARCMQEQGVEQGTESMQDKASIAHSIILLIGRMENKTGKTKYMHGTIL